VLIMSQMCAYSPADHCHSLHECYVGAGTETACHQKSFRASVTPSLTQWRMSLSYGDLLLLLLPFLLLLLDRHCRLCLQLLLCCLVPS
jgi:hypothetical protein